MKEARFIKLRKALWEQIDEQSLSGKQKEPDRLAEEYIALSDDLSYSRTFYPKSKTTAYLNEKASRLHQRIYKSKKESRSRFRQFWLEEIPREMYQARRSMVISLVMFLLATLIGAVSMKYNPDFARVILGDAYVNLTERNIAQNDPMAIYAMSRQDDMFMRITLNNIQVSFFVYVLGIFTPLLPISLLFRNGIMLGCFQYFFVQHGLFVVSAQAVWIHGTIEISSIIVAGGAGIHMGAGWLFPGTYKRIESFQRAAKSSVKIVAGLIPFFVIAGFLESFVTRYYLNPAIGVPIIAASVGLVFWYFIYLPYMKHRYES